MQWSELCEKAKEMGYVSNTYDDIFGSPKQDLTKDTPDGRLRFYEDGMAIIVCNTDKMYQIMEALR